MAGSWCPFTVQQKHWQRRYLTRSNDGGPIRFACVPPGTTARALFRFRRPLRQAEEGQKRECDHRYTDKPEYIIHRTPPYFQLLWFSALVKSEIFEFSQALTVQRCKLRKSSDHLLIEAKPGFL